MKQRREKKLESFRRRLRKAHSITDALNVGWERLPRSSKERAAASLDRASPSSHALDDPFVYELWTAIFSRSYGDGAQNLMTLIDELRAQFAPIEEIDKRDVSHEVEYVRRALSRPRPTRAELDAAVVCTVLLCHHFAGAPAEYLADFYSALEQKRSIADGLSQAASARGGRESGAVRAKLREATIERAAKVWLALEANEHVSRVTLKRLADASGVPLPRLENIGSRAIKERAEQLRASRVSASRRTPKSRDK